MQALSASILSIQFMHSGWKPVSFRPEGILFRPARWDLPRGAWSSYPVFPDGRLLIRKRPEGFNGHVRTRQR